MPLNQRIKILRKSLGLSQIAFAEEIESSKSAIDRYEKEGTDVPSSVLATIIEKYKILPNWLFFGEGGESPQYQEEYVKKEKYEAVSEQVNALQSELIKYQKKEIEALEKQNANRGETSISEAKTSN